MPRPPTQPSIPSRPQGGFSPWLTAILVVLAVLALRIAFGAIEGETSAKTPPVHRVEPYTLSESAHYQVARRLSGTVRARQSTDLGFEAGGKVATIYVNEGDRVSAGTLLAKLDTVLLTGEQRELDAQFKEIDARLTLVENNLKRQQQLKDKGFTSEQRMDELNAERDTLTANLQRLNAALTTVQNRLAKARLIAPFAGTVSHRFADEGAVLGPGVALVRLQQEGVMEAHLGVPVELVDRFIPGQHYTVSIDGKDLEATVMTVGTTMDTGTRTVQVRLALPNDTPAVQNNLVILTLEETVDQTGFWVPVTAVTDGVRGLWTVYTLEPAPDSKGHYRLEARDVQISYGTDTQLYVTGDLQSDQRIAATGLQRLVPGQIVSLVDNRP